MMAKERERETTRTKLKCNRMMLIYKLKFALLYSIIKENWEKDPKKLELEPRIPITRGCLCDLIKDSYYHCCPLSRSG